LADQAARIHLTWQRELVRLHPDAIVVVGTPPGLAGKRQAATIPTILAPAADPLRTGLVTSLAHPDWQRSLEYRS